MSDLGRMIGESIATTFVAIAISAALIGVGLAVAAIFALPWAYYHLHVSIG